MADIDPADTYKAMEKLLDTGKVKAIGVSNFDEQRLTDLLSKTTVVPAVNQIEAHPYLQQPAFTKFCQDKGILVEAYSPLGNNTFGEPKTVDDAKVKDIAKKLDLDGGNVLCSWGIQRGTVVLPKSVTEHRIINNLKVKELSKEDFDALNALERNKRFNDPGRIRWGFDTFHECDPEVVKKNMVDSGPENIKKFG